MIPDRGVDFADAFGMEVIKIHFILYDRKELESLN
jgi:hypothetical protein